jgi:SAM-dependent methyltransferase
MLPAASPAILEQTFGKGWRTPDRGFKHQSPSRKIDKAYFVAQPRLSALYWKQFYRDNNVTDGSPFAKFVAGRLPPQCTIIEIGCGTGRDAVFFAEHGHAVFGADRAEEGVKRASAAAGERGLQTSFSVVDASHRKGLAAFIGGVPVSARGVVYMRFFLHSIPVEVQELIFDEVSRLPSGYLLALEFRTDKDALQPKVYGEHYRRYIKPSSVIESLERRGFKIDFEEEGTGLSPFGEEDPHLARILARKT